MVLRYQLVRRYLTDQSKQIGPSRALRRTSPVPKRTFTFPPEVACRIPTSVRLKDNGMFPVLLCSLLLLHGSLGEIVFRCPSCTAERQAACPKLTTSCEIVREPGCGCCPVCARQKGEQCGVYTPRCGSGLRCYPSANSELPLEQLIQGLGRCENKVDLEPTMTNQESGHSAFSSFSLCHVYCDCLWIPSGSDVLRHALFNTFTVPAVGTPRVAAACRDLRHQ
ncbi:Insulin-like growth factor-binding protein 2-B [Labeo rohita]|uniref:Insulin-like growth factor-binding protein 2-B n=1 Tax=Labeo rohita TaxID=84645 RepID=A0ABQ8MDD1_LABRO|nr:Insulin-like growth factor-binding protein 2-B [Labeo rohita]